MEESGTVRDTGSCVILSGEGRLCLVALDAEQYEFDKFYKEQPFFLSSMKVVLVSTPLTLGKRYTEFGGIEFPLAVGYLASYTRQHGFDVELWDYTPGGYAEDEYIDKLRNSSPKVIGLSCTTPTILNANKLAQIAKRVLPEVLVIIGGPHATAIPERTLKEFPAFDAIFFRQC